MGLWPEGVWNNESKNNHWQGKRSRQSNICIITWRWVQLRREGRKNQYNVILQCFCLSKFVHKIDYWYSCSIWAVFTSTLTVVIFRVGPVWAFFLWLENMQLNYELTAYVNNTEAFLHLVYFRKMIAQFSFFCFIGSHFQCVQICRV